MATIRRNILEALVTRLAAISGWQVSLRTVDNITPSSGVVAVVYPVSEDKQLANSAAYLATLQVGVLITARVDELNAVVDAGNPFLYLDRMVSLAEARIHAPDSWGLAPDFTDVVVNGHEVDEVDGDPTSVHAFLRLTFTYRHSITSPEVA
jgi:hypothetical protein